MSLYSDTELHRDHCEWAQERAMWHDDVRVWQEEVEEVGGKLKRIEAALAQQKHDLQVHAAAVRMYGERDGRREHLLAEYERDGNEERGMLLGYAHEGEIQQQERQRERHEEIKATQRRLMADLRALLAAADRLPPAPRQRC